LIISARTIKVTATSGVAVIWLDRPKARNAMDTSMMSELEEALASLDGKRSIRAVVIAGQGTDFCSGKDIARLVRPTRGRSTADESEAMAMAMARLLDRLDVMKKATVARIHGTAQGCALGLIAACDVVVAALDSEFCAPEWGLDPTSASIAPYLIRAMGERQCRRYLLTGERFTAAEAYRIGLVHELASPEELDARVNEILGHLLANEVQALPRAKENIFKSARKDHSRG
jgi:methylglutaconyl-CoA hydratase